MVKCGEIVSVVAVSQPTSWARRGSWLYTSEQKSWPFPKALLDSDLRRKNTSGVEGDVSQIVQFCPIGIKIVLDLPMGGNR